MTTTYNTPFFRTATMTALGVLLALFSAVAQADGLTFVHTDHLGTPVAYTNGAGDVIGREYVTPYGESLNPPTGNDQPAFTSHVRDGSTGLVYMQARYYDPVTGRMLSADPVEFSGGGVSHFGRYHYANGNPVNLVDPTGMIAHREDAFDCSNDANCKDMAGGGAATRSASSSGTGQLGTAGSGAEGNETSGGGTATGGEASAPTTPDPVAEIALSQSSLPIEPLFNFNSNYENGESATAVITGRLGLFGSFKAKPLGGLFKLQANLDAFSFWTGDPLITQGVAVDTEILGVDVTFGFSRYSTNGGLSWSDWEWGGGAFNLRNSNQGVTFEVGAGIGIGFEFSVPIIPAAN